MKLHGAIAYAFFYFSNVIRKRLRIFEHIFLLLLIFALPTMVSCSRSDFQSNDNGVKLDEEPLVIFSFPGQKTSTLKLTIRNHFTQPLVLSTFSSSPPYFYMDIPQISLMPNDTTECLATVHFREEFIDPAVRNNKESIELIGDMFPETQLQTSYQGRVIKFKLIYDKFFRENPEGSVKIIIPDDSIPTIDLRLTTYRVMDKVQLEQSDEILAGGYPKSQIVMGYYQEKFKKNRFPI